MVSATDILSEYIAHVEFRDIPTHVVEYAKDLILDSIGCAIAGISIAPGKVVSELFTELGGRPEASVLATGRKVPCIHAAYVNSYLAHILEFDDIGTNLPGHPSTTIVPAGLAVAERVHADGKETITALVAAYEGWGRICQAMTPSPARQVNVWGVGTHQVFGAAIAACRLLRFSPAQTARALGLAGANAPVPSFRKFLEQVEAGKASWEKTNFGWASMGGVLAALLVERGFVGPQDVLDGANGFWIMAGSDQCDFEALTRNLGTDFFTTKTAFKPFAANRLSHSALEATSRILTKHRIDVEQIEEIRVETISEVAKAQRVQNPDSIVQAGFSLPHLIAIELLGRSPSRGLCGDDLIDRTVRTLARKVSIQVSPELDERFKRDRLFRSSQVSIQLLEGEVFSERVDIPPWGPENRPSREALQAKFANLASPVIGMDGALALIKDVERLTEITDVSAMVSRVGPALEK